VISGFTASLLPLTTLSTQARGQDRERPVERHNDRGHAHRHAADLGPVGDGRPRALHAAFDDGFQAMPLLGREMDDLVEAWRELGRQPAAVLEDRHLDGRFHAHLAVLANEQLDPLLQAVLQGAERVGEHLRPPFGGEPAPFAKGPVRGGHRIERVLLGSGTRVADHLFRARGIEHLEALGRLALLASDKQRHGAVALAIVLHPGGEAGALLPGPAGLRLRIVAGERLLWVIGHGGLPSSTRAGGRSACR
jgi:hypothetical protein